MLGGYLILLIMIGSLFCNIFQNQRIVDLLFEKKNSKKKLKDLEELQVIFMQDQQFFQKFQNKIKKLDDCGHILELGISSFESYGL